MAYTTIDDAGSYFNTVLYTGNGSTQSITGVGFQPDWLWIKRRSTTEHSCLEDAIRGAGYSVRSTSSDAQQYRDNDITSFDSDGFSLGANAECNGNTETNASWNWKANGAGSANTEGTAANVTVSADQTAGFSIVQFDATQSRVSVGHGLGSTPDAIIMKETEGVGNWVAGGFGLDWSGYILLDTTAAFVNDSDDSSGSGRMFTPDGYAPTSSVWSTNGSAFLSATTKTCIAYCFAEKQGYSKFSSYTGNGNADGPFVYTGFRPACLIRKRTDSTNDWYINDNKRLGYNPNNAYLFPNADQAESDLTRFDFLSNGFKIRTTDTGDNADGGTYLYMAFADSPFVNSEGVPTNAR